MTDRYTADQLIVQAQINVASEHGEPPVRLPPIFDAGRPFTSRHSWPAIFLILTAVGQRKKVLAAGMLRQATRNSVAAANHEITSFYRMPGERKPVLRDVFEIEIVLGGVIHARRGREHQERHNQPRIIKPEERPLVAACQHMSGDLPALPQPDAQ